MKVEIAEQGGGAAIICHCGVDEVKFTHVESKVDVEGNPLDEFDVMVALLNAASAGVTAMPRPEQAPLEGETPAARVEREERTRKALEDYEAKERERLEPEPQAASPAPVEEERQEQREGEQPQY